MKAVKVIPINEFIKIRDNLIEDFKKAKFEWHDHVEYLEGKQETPEEVWQSCLGWFIEELEDRFSIEE